MDKVERQKILIVDDHSDIRRLIKMIMREKEYLLFEACNGSSALEKIQDCQPDLILLDIMMPGYPNGLELLRSIIENQLTNAKVIMISAKGQASDILAATMLGCDGYIVKPFKQQQLLDAVKKALPDLEKLRESL